MAAWIERTVDAAFGKLSDIETYLADRVLLGWSPAHIPDLSGKVYLVTGGNSGLGFETCRKLVENGAHVYMVSRDIANGQRAAMQIRNEVGKQARLDVLECDMSSLSDVVSLAREFKRNSSKLDCLINNAGVFHPGPFALTGDQLEQTLHVNFYAHALLTLLLLDTLRDTPGSRVLFTSSPAETFGKLDWGNLTGEKYRDSGMTPYGTSKLYEMMFAKEMAVRVPEVDFLTVHPGVVDTPLQLKVDYRYWAGAAVAIAAHFIGLTPYHGAWSLMYTATEPSLTGKHWTFIGPNRVNMWPTTERKPFNKPIYNPTSCWRLTEEAVRILQSRLGGAEKVEVPPHPKGSASLAPAVHDLPAAVGKWL